MSGSGITANFLKACVICSDERGRKMVELLLPQFQEVYLISSGNDDYQHFSEADRTGTILTKAELPPSVHTMFFHSGNDILWQAYRSSIATPYTFEFNTPGTPSHRENVMPIFRATAPYFGITDVDIHEVAEYILQKRDRPSMCIPVLDALPALSILCQHFLETTGTALTQPIDWLQALGLTDPEQSQDTKLKLLEDVEQEWRIWNRSSASKKPLDHLLTTILGEYSNSTIAPEIVQQAYDEVVQKLGHGSEAKLERPQRNHDFVAIRGSFASMAIASVLSAPKTAQAIDPKKPQIGSKNSTIILLESNIDTLEKLRSQGFSGSVLVISSQPFSVLKQKHRVLRFGQGSHSALTAPWSLADLHAHIAELLPLEPENLRLWQMEARARQTFCKQRTEVLQEQRQSLKDGDRGSIEKMVKVVEELRSEARVACHISVNIEGEHRQLQQHFQTALEALGRSSDRLRGIKLLEKAFACLGDVLSPL